MGSKRLGRASNAYYFIRNNPVKGECPAYKLVIKGYFSEKETSPQKEESVYEKEDDELVKTAWEEHSRREE